MQERTIIQKPAPGSQYPKSPNRRIQATMLISITFFIPNRRRKKGIVRMKRVSDICDIDIMIAGYLTATRSLYAGIFAKSWRNVSPYALVSCNEAPSNMAKMKNRAILVLLKSLNAFKPNSSISDFLCPEANGGHFGRVKA